jgi:branched-chain amino acid transport system permease protein
MDYLLHIVILCLIYVLFAASLDLELGFAGLYNLGHVAFFGIGAYVSALTTLGGLPVWLGMCAGMLAACAAGALFAFPTLRLTGDYFGIASLSFGEMVRLFFLNARGLTKGPMGLPGIPRPDWFGDSTSLAAYLAVCLIIVAAGMAWLHRLSRSPFGRTLKVIREDEDVARAFGKRVVSFKVRCVAAGSALGGLAGALWAHYVTYISPNDFTITGTILVLLCVVVGGKGTILGPALGAFIVIGFQEAVRFLPLPPELGRLVTPLQGMVFGAALIALMLWRPEGMLGERRGGRA